jgi:hypothetical protein
MIYAVLTDGTRRALDQASVTLTWAEPGPNEDVLRSFILKDVVKLVMIEPDVRIAPGNMNGMPVVGIALHDTSDVVVEVPMPADYAEDMGRELQQYAKVSREAAIKLREIAKRGGQEIAKAMTDAASLFGTKRRGDGAP